MDLDLAIGMLDLIVKAKTDYYAWFGASQYRIDEFNDGLRYEEGSKYIKVIIDHSVHSFIVKQDGGKFRRGDILKAASWAAPAKNFARGNVLDGTLDRIRWTGAL